MSKVGELIKEALMEAIQENLNEAKKLLATHSSEDGSSVAKVYKLSGEHNEGDPYHVKMFYNGKHHEPSDYFTNDEEDAHSTAKHMCKK